MVRGSGLAEVTAIGAQSEIGKIGQSLATLETEPPRLQVQTRRVVRLFAVLGGGVSVLAVLLYGIMRGGWLDAVLAGIALGMSMLPEEFPVVLTVFMAMGAWRISLARVLTRRAAAIETLGSATVLCTDKTGTLTENRMTIVELRLTDGNIFRPQDGTEMPAQFHDLSEFGLLASAPEPFDPMEQAFHALARERLTEAAYRHPHWKLVHAYGLRPDLLAVTHVWQADGDRQEYLVAAKGAPEAIAGLCRLSAADRAALTQSIDAMASAGLRVLGVARAAHAGPPWPASPRELSFEFLGLVGLADPLARQRRRGGPRMPVGRHQGRHDHRRLSGDRERDRAAGRARTRRARDRRTAREVERGGIGRPGAKRPACSRGSRRARSCASSTPTRPMARSSR